MCVAVGSGDPGSLVGLSDSWRAMPPFRWLAGEAVDARLTLPVGGSPPPAGSWTAGSGDPVPRRITDSEVGWLITDPWMWSLVPLWPRLHEATISLVRAVTELDERIGTPCDGDRHRAVVSGFLSSISGDIRRLACRVVAGVSMGAVDEADARPDPQGSAEVSVSAELAERYGGSVSAAEFAAAHAPLFNQIDHVLANHCGSFRSMTRRLADDWSALTGFTGSSSATLRGVSAMGDLHERGAVLALDLSTGNRMLYKPRSLLLDVRLAELYSWLECGEPGLAPRMPHSIDRHHYGWQECVAARECTDGSEVTAFYRRTGALLALAYALRATDLHHENVICHGASPVVVDPECFFGTSFQTSADGQDEHNGPRGATVLDIGILPDPLRRDDVNEPLDVSTLGYVGARRTPRIWRELMRDASGRIHLQRRAAPLPPAGHVPFLNGREVPVHGHERTLLDGFRAAYRRLMSGRAELLGADGLLARFAGARVRHILRGTSTYVSVIWELGNPVAAGCGVKQEEVVNALWPQDAHDRPEIARVFAHERSGLLRGCVPTFERSAAGRTLEMGSGPTQPLCKVSGLELVRQRVARLCERDLQLQTTLTETTLTIPHIVDDRRAKAYTPTESDPLDRDRLLGIADGIRETLTAAMVLANGPAWWLVGAELRDGVYAVQPSSFSLYDGSAGIALFAGYLDVVTGRRSVLAEAAERAMTEGAERMLERGTISQLARARQLGVFDGLWGCVYTAACLGMSRGDARLAKWAVEVGHELAPGSAELAGWDVIGGTAGIGAVASELALRSDDGEFTEAARTALDATCVHLERVLSGERILTGVAHGMSGVALAFERGARLFPAEGLDTAAAIAWEAEHSRCYADDRGWHDALAEGDAVAQDAKREGWCRGAAGIGLALAAGPRRGGQEAERIRLAGQLALRRAIGTDHSLCHGAMGAVEFFATATADVPDTPSLDRLVAGVAASAGRWVTGLPERLPDPGLMTGVAGIGYGILRLLEPRLVPRVLTLQGPGAGALRAGAPGSAS